jgi:hypothetical protein
MESSLSAMAARNLLPVINVSQTFLMMADKTYVVLGADSGASMQCRYIV